MELFKVYMECRAFGSATRAEVAMFLQRERLPELLVSDVAKTPMPSRFCIVYLKEKEHADLLIDQRHNFRFKGEPVYVSWYKSYESRKKP